MVAGSTFSAAACPRLKREDCDRTRHDSAFSDWKILIGPSDWEDYLLEKEGAERYRIHNLPNCCSCSGIYELGIATSLSQSGRGSRKLSSKCIIPVYLGQADNVRTRLQQYGREGAHLENGCSNGDVHSFKGRGLFTEIFSRGFAVVYRWAPMRSKAKAEKTEELLLGIFDYAWNKEKNGVRRPNDIYHKLDSFSSSPKILVPRLVGKLNIFRPGKVGPRIETFYKKEEESSDGILRIIKFGRSRPTPVSKQFAFSKKEEESSDGILRIIKFGRSRPTPVLKQFGTCEYHPSVCGIAIDDRSICSNRPAQGRKRCEMHKGNKAYALFSSRVPACGIKEEVCTADEGDTENVEFSREGVKVEEHKFQFLSDKALMFTDTVDDDRRGNGYSSTCGALTSNGSLCKRKPGEGSTLCWQHQRKIAGTFSRLRHGDKSANFTAYPLLTTSNTGNADVSFDLTCDAITRNGLRCRRRTSDGEKQCWQHRG